MAHSWNDHCNCHLNYHVMLFHWKSIKLDCKTFCTKFLHQPIKMWHLEERTKKNNFVIFTFFSLLCVTFLLIWCKNLLQFFFFLNVIFYSGPKDLRISKKLYFTLEFGYSILRFTLLFLVFHEIMIFVMLLKLKIPHWKNERISCSLS